MSKILLLLFLTGAAYAEPSPTEKISIAAEAFGPVPDVWGAALSPDGTSVSFLHMMGGQPIAYTMAIGGEPQPLITGDRDVYWCRWANEERLLCGFRVNEPAGNASLYGLSRLKAVSVGGEDVRLLFKSTLRDYYSQFADNVIDWLPDDHDHVLMRVPLERGYSVARVNIYTGRKRRIEHTPLHGFARQFQLSQTVIYHRDGPLRDVKAPVIGARFHQFLTHRTVTEPDLQYLFILHFGEGNVYE